MGTGSEIADGNPINPYDEADIDAISGTLLRGAYPGLALSMSKGEVEGCLGVT